MDMTLRGLVQASVDTVRDPRGGARVIMSLGIGRRQRWEILLLIVVLSAVLAQVSFLIATMGQTQIIGAFSSSPIALGIVQLVLLVAMVLGVHFIGRRAGGKGNLDDAILLVSWLQFIMICLQVIQTIALLVFPALSFFVGLAGLGLFFWLLTHFISELHGFKSMTAVFVGIVVSMVGFAIILSVALGLFGIYLPGAQ